MIESRWKAMTAILSTIAAVIVGAFGAGVAWNTVRAEQSLIPQQLTTLEVRVDLIQELTRTSAELLQDLVCDIRGERGEFDANCIRRLPPPATTPRG